MTFEEIVRKPQHKLKKALNVELQRMGYKTIVKPGFVYAGGALPVLLVAHMDTVHREPVKTICHSPDGRFVMSPQGIGGDDRAGAYMILQIIKHHRCHVLFCEDEEIGGIGATEFIKSHIRPEINYMVELDRRGVDDAVFYDCDNPEFTAFVCGFGFQEEFGTFSDISIIAPELRVAAVNLSAGYDYEHTKHEYVDMNAIDLNIQRVGHMVSSPSDRFAYIEAKRSIRRSLFDGWCDAGMAFQTIPLMPLPASAVIQLPSGELTESDIQFLIDEAGGIYEYLFDLDAAVKLDGWVAHTEHGLPVKFRWSDMEYVEVISPESAWESDYREEWNHG